jgi:hypothetical protein
VVTAKMKYINERLQNTQNRAKNKKRYWFYLFKWYN